MPSKADPNISIANVSDSEDLDSEELTPLDQTDEQLVAYLDGELEDTERAELEERLVGSDLLRVRLGELQSGWEMLDVLPATNVTEDFARTTVEMIAASQSQIMRAQRKRRPWKQFGWVAALLLTTCLLSVIGYAIPGWLNQREFESQLDDLWLAENLDAYLVEENLSLIEKLGKDQVWQDAMRLASDAGGINISPPLDLSQRDREERLAIIERLERDTKVSLSANWDGLRNLDQQQLAAVRKRAEEVLDTQSPTRTLQTLRQYAVWWQQISGDARNRIFQTAPEQRFEVIQTEVQESSGRWVRYYPYTYIDSDRVPIEQQLLAIAAERLRRAKEMLDADSRGERQRTRMRNTWWKDFAPSRMLAVMAMRNTMGDRPLPREDDESNREILETLLGPPTDQELSAIEELMSKQALAILNAQSDVDGKRREMLWNWCMDIAQQMSPSPNSPEAILSRYQVLDDELRERLDYQTAERILDRLKGERFGRPGR